MDNPSKKARKESEPGKQPPLPQLPDDPTPQPQPEPTPGTSSETPGKAPGGGDVDPDPESPFKWDSDPENWRKPRLPTKHSKCLYMLVSAGFRVVTTRSKRVFYRLDRHSYRKFTSKRGSAS